MADYKYTQNTTQLQKDIDDVETLVAGGKVNSLGLSAESYSTAEKTKLGALPTNAQLETALGAKQDVISDLSTIRSGAAAGATAYQKPSGGVPASDMASAVQTSLGKADSAYQKPVVGIPPTDMEPAVQASLGLAESAYQKPSSGIPKSDLDASVKDSLDKADSSMQKDDDAVEGNLAKFDSNGNPVDAGIAAEKVAQKGEIQTYSGNLVDTRSAGTAQEFTYRKSGGDGVNWMRRIKGMSLVWNQLCPFTSAPVITNATWTDNTLLATAKNGQVYWNAPTVSIIAGHKYIQIATLKTTAAARQIRAFSLGESINLYNVASGSYQVLAGIATATNPLAAIAIRDTRESDWDAIEVAGVMLIDLTLLFGEGKEPSTMAEFEALYNEPYYPYQPGIIKNNDAVAMESVGFNQLDEEWEVGNININTGQDEPSSTNIRSKNYIAVFSGITYYCKFGSGAGLRICAYDANKNYLSTISGLSSLANTTFAIPTNAKYIRIGSVGYGATYNHDICINISDASRNGEYEPYWKKSIQLGLNAFRVTDGTNIITVNGLKSAGDAYDEIDTVRKKYIKRIGEVDMGSLIWQTVSSYFYAQMVLAHTIDNDHSNMMCAKYPVLPFSQRGVAAFPLLVFDGVSNKNIQARNTGYETAAAFKTAMSGVPLYYELGTPVEYDLVDDIPNAIEVDENGTERAIFPEAVDPSAPFAADSNYSVSTANLVRKLNDAS